MANTLLSDVSRKRIAEVLARFNGSLAELTEERLAEIAAPAVRRLIEDRMTAPPRRAYTVSAAELRRVRENLTGDVLGMGPIAYLDLPAIQRAAWERRICAGIDAAKRAPVTAAELRARVPR